MENVIDFVVEKIVYRGADYFVVLKGLNKEDDSLCTVIGQIPEVHLAMKLTLTGRWVDNLRFGKQFQVQSSESALPSDIEGIEKFLGEGFVKGVGKATASALIKEFGSETLNVLDKNPEKLNAIPRLGKTKILAIVDAWRGIKESSMAFVFLAKLGVTKFFANKLFNVYGYGVVEKIKANPYLLAKEVWGVGFLKADAIAKKMHIPLNSMYRVAAAIRHILQQTLERGSLFLEESVFFLEVTKVLQYERTDVYLELIKNTVISLINADELSIKSQNQKRFYAFKKVVLAEEELALMLRYLMQAKQNLQLDVSEIFLKQNFCGDGLITLSDEQMDAVGNSLVNPITIITGGPGTGKTTLLKFLIKFLQNKKLSFFLVAPTGRAAKRMQQSTNSFAQTLHRLLEFDPIKKAFGKNKDNCIDSSFIIVDEFSMVDLFLFNGLLRAVNPVKTKLILIGDVDQLPSVGPGKILQDLIESKKIKTVCLNNVFRQAKESLIIENAHRVNQGEFPSFNRGSVLQKDFVFVKMEDPAQFSAFLHKDYSNLLSSKKLKFDDSMVLSPMHKGLVGTLEINSVLQNMLNNSYSSEIKTFNQSFRVGDPVMQLRNNYEKGVFNGDTGKILELKNSNNSEATMTVDFFGKNFLYKQNEFSELSLAYAMSIHKSQGSEFAAVLIPVFTQHFMMLNKNVLYTAITRAKKLCILVGQVKAIAIAIKKSQPLERITFLRDLL